MVGMVAKPHIEVAARLHRMENLIQAINNNPEPNGQHASASHSASQNRDPQRTPTSANLCFAPSPISSEPCTGEALPRAQELSVEDMNTEMNTESQPALFVPDISNSAAPTIITAKRRKRMRPQADLLDQILSKDGRSDNADINAAIWIRTTVSLNDVSA